MPCLLCGIYLPEFEVHSSHIVPQVLGLLQPQATCKECEEGAVVRAQVYSQSEEGQVVNTAWALLALISAGYHRRDRRPIEAAVRSLVQAQLPSGDWPQQHISGVFNRNCMITYANYRCDKVTPCVWGVQVFRGCQNS